MMRIYITAQLLVLSFLLSLPVHAINKCTDAHGKVSYQDKPCPTSQNAETIKARKDRNSENPDNFVPVLAQIPGLGKAILFSYKWWDAYVIQPNKDLPPIVKMRSKDGEEPLSFSLSFLPNVSGKKMSVKESAELVSQMASSYISGSIEQEVRLKQLSTSIGTAVYASFNEQKYLNKPVPQGEYSSITVGQVAHAEIVVAFTILTNGSQTKALDEAFNIISSFQILAPK